ncbi:hypothetical protein QR680_015757 [Steinernema hermaphroditum]|uniref:Uncharacterized protein n=1 Tax=Steinernema hermaphroditum TaxID=289476 RepID=A0AA39H8V1_9BILA|nr:hypothetical protein QR680_015757 [Steinernema hermaphroditum]
MVIHTYGLFVNITPEPPPSSGAQTTDIVLAAVCIIVLTVFAVFAVAAVCICIMIQKSSAWQRDPFSLPVFSKNAESRPILSKRCFPYHTHSNAAF